MQMLLKERERETGTGRERTLVRLHLYGVHSALNACSERKVKGLEMSNSFGLVVFILRIQKIIKKLKWAESGWTDEQRTSVRGNEPVSGACRVPSASCRLADSLLSTQAHVRLSRHTQRSFLFFLFHLQNEQN